MSEKRDIAGLWWLPTNPDERWAGTLTLEQNKSPKLTIAVQKSAFEAFGQKLSAPPVIHGCDQNGSPISLIIPGWPRTRGGMALSQVEYSAHYAILNLEVSHQDDFKVNEFTLRMQHLQGWFGVTGFLRPELNSPEVDLCIRYKNPKDEAFPIGKDLSVEFRPGYTLHNGFNERKLQENINVTFVSKDGMNLSQCKEFLNDFRLLLHFATLREIYPLEIKARKEGHGSTHEGEFIYQDIEIWNSIIKEEVSADWHPNEWIFKFADVRQKFSDFFSSWIKLTADHEEALSCYCATVYHKLSTTIEHLCLTQALEAYHGVKFASRKQQNFCGKIQALTEAHKEHLKGLVDNAVEFAEIVRDNRHYYTHHNPEDLKAGRIVSGAKLIRLNEKLELIFQMCVLTEMGIPAERFSRLRRQLAFDIIEFV
jgi:hypothetical protein